MKSFTPSFAPVVMAFLVSVCTSCKEKPAEKSNAVAAPQIDVFSGADFEDLPAGLAKRVNAFFSDLLEGELVSLEHRDLDIADDGGATSNYILERLVDHPAMFEEDAPYPMLHKQFPGMERMELLTSIRDVHVADVAPFTEGGEKYYHVMGEFSTSEGKTGKFCLRLREEPGSADPGAIENYYLFPSAVG